jgi:hypothetical protein
MLLHGRYLTKSPAVPLGAAEMGIKEDSDQLPGRAFFQYAAAQTD